MVSGAVEYRDVPETEEFPYKRSYTNITAGNVHAENENVRIHEINVALNLL